MLLKKDASPILPLTSVRFLAAAYVVLHHCALWTHHLHVDTWMGRFERNGFVAVSFFFTLSGYILAHVYLDKEKTFNSKSFLISRFARIYPLLFLCLLLDLPRFLYQAFQSQLPHHVLKSSVAACFSFLLLQAWAGLRLLTLDPPSWSLSAEAFFYAVFPLLAFRFARAVRRVGWGAILCLWLLSMAVPGIVTFLKPDLFVQVDTSPIQWIITLNPLLRIPEFLAGIALCALDRQDFPRKLSEVQERIGYFAIAGGLVLFSLFIESANHIPYMIMANGLMIPPSLLIIFGLSRINNGLAGLLSNKWMVVLGESSYALYLVHSVLFAYLTLVLPETSVWFWGLFTLLILALSTLSFFVIERPVREYILHRARIRPVVIHEQEAVPRENLISNAAEHLDIPRRRAAEEQ